MTVTNPSSQGSQEGNGMSVDHMHTACRETRHPAWSERYRRQDRVARRAGSVSGLRYSAARRSSSWSFDYDLDRTVGTSGFITAGKSVEMLVPGEGFEPPTFGLQNRCTATVLTRLSTFFRVIPFGIANGERGSPHGNRVFADAVTEIDS